MRRCAVLLPMASAKTSNKPMVLGHQPKALKAGAPDSLARADLTFDENAVPAWTCIAADRGRLFLEARKPRLFQFGAEHKGPIRAAA